MLVLTYADYQTIIVKTDSLYEGFVINPYGDNIVINKNILNNVYPRKYEVKKNESVMIGIPKDYPIQMVKKLKTAFKSIVDVKKAYLLWMARNQEMSYLLVLDTSGNEKEVFPLVGEICEPYLGGKPLDMVTLKSKFGQDAVENQKPFYQK
ncbi:MAG: enhanced serine sensitivity protein SseB C-terminal domain-containing protein [Eubacteriales bacterium]|nr:enhanced serine sensitivity protein SseB C-terminal domain-containing protein [Eubacteriales bacterium]